MEKVLSIKGMSCNHCVTSVTKALMDIEGVTAVSVSLDEKNATVTASKDIDDSVFSSVIDSIGFELV